VNCQDSRDLVHAYVDGELDLVRHLEVEGHLRECPACARAHEQQQALRAALRAGSLRFEAPAGLRRRIRSSLRRAGRGRRAFPGTLGPWLVGVAAALALVALGAGLVARFSFASDPEEWLVREAVSAHARTVVGEHPTDITTPDRHEIKPYLTRKLGFPPWVQDLAGQGFPLVGGRVDYLNDRPVAALVYQRRKHRINLFTWPATREPDSAPRALSRQGYRVYHWTQAGMAYWVVSDLNDAELQEFVQLVQTNP
jgi:mycothiol system anti-sigma-R factor